MIVTAPPMAASFFQGMLGAFTPYTAFSSDGGARASRYGRCSGGNSYPPGHGGNPGGVHPQLGPRASGTPTGQSLHEPYLDISSNSFTVTAQPAFNRQFIPNQMTIGSTSGRERMC